MKLLSIGNSFSQDSHAYLHELSMTGEKIETTDLVIGGCSLERHVSCLENKSEEYSYELNGGPTVRHVSLNEIIESDRFDVITVQQASHFSGRPQTYFPYLRNLVDFCREKQPDAALYFHQTWAYETDSEHPAFADYDHDQAEMFRRITDCSEMVTKTENLKLIPTGAVIQHLRDHADAFHYAQVGRSLCRDGFHLSWDYGRYTAAAVWMKVLTGCSPRTDDFHGMDPDILQTILSAVDVVLAGY